jgi:hypothetical protein
MGFKKKPKRGSEWACLILKKVKICFYPAGQTQTGFRMGLFNTKEGQNEKNY